MAADGIRRPRLRAPRRLCFLMAAIAAAGCDAPTAAPPRVTFDPTSLTGGLVYHWTPGATISIYADTTGFDPLFYNIETAVAHAAKVWREEMYYREVDLRIASSPSEADIIIHHRGVPRLVNTVVNGGDCDLDPIGVGGYTLFCPDVGDALILPLRDGSGGRVKMDIFVNPASSSGPNHFQGFYALVAHEIGHALGIGGHSQEPDDLMYPIPTAMRPTDRDAAALRAVLYRKADIRF